MDNDCFISVQSLEDIRLVRVCLEDSRPPYLCYRLMKLQHIARISTRIFIHHEVVIHLGAFPPSI